VSGLGWLEIGGASGNLRSLYFLGVSKSRNGRLEVSPISGGEPVQVLILL